MLLQELSRSRLFDSFREMERIQNQLNKLFENYSAWRSTSEYPPINVYVSEDSVVVTSEMPGVSLEDLDVSVVNDTLTLRGKRLPDEFKSGEMLHRRERHFGEFSRSIQLPFRINAEGVKANFKKGVLHLALPRAEEDKPRKISVQVA